MHSTQSPRAPPPASLGWTEATGTAAWSKSLSIVIPKSKTGTYTYRASPEHLLSPCTVTFAIQFKSQKKKNRPERRFKMSSDVITSLRQKLMRLSELPQFSVGAWTQSRQHLSLLRPSNLPIFGKPH